MILASHEDTRRLARELLGRLPAGSLLILTGEMGSGKTTLVAGLAAALGSTAAVSSPTYTLIHEYPTPEGRLIHIDAWRLPEAASLVEMGLDEYLEDARLVAVEWGAGLGQLYPEALNVHLEVSASGVRRATVSGGT